MGLSLDGLWDLKLAFKLTWGWEHLLDIHLYITLTCCLYWPLKFPLVHGKDIWLEFNLEHWMDL